MLIMSLCSLPGLHKFIICILNIISTSWLHIGKKILSKMISSASGRQHYNSDTLQKTQWFLSLTGIFLNVTGQWTIFGQTKLCKLN